MLRYSSSHTGWSWSWPTNARCVAVAGLALARAASEALTPLARADGSQSKRKSCNFCVRIFHCRARAYRF